MDEAGRKRAEDVGIAGFKPQGPGAASAGFDGFTPGYPRGHFTVDYSAISQPVGPLVNFTALLPALLCTPQYTTALLV